MAGSQLDHEMRDPQVMGFNTRLLDHGAKVVARKLSGGFNLLTMDPWIMWPCWPGSDWSYRFHIQKAYVVQAYVRKKIPTKFGLKYSTNVPPSIGSWRSPIDHMDHVRINEVHCFSVLGFWRPKVAKEKDLPIGRPDQPGQLFWAKLVSENGDLPDLPIKKAFFMGKMWWIMMINHQILGYQNLRQTKMSRESQPVSPTWKMWTKRLREVLKLNSRKPSCSDYLNGKCKDDDAFLSCR